jgi:hypothetical protein
MKNESNNNSHHEVIVGLGMGMAAMAVSPVGGGQP